MSKMMMIDGLQYSHWSRRVFEQMREGGLSAVHVTIAYHELSRETLQNIGQWNRLFEIHSDLIMPVHTATDIELAHGLNKVGIIFGFQNCSPIEDDIDLVAIFHQLGVRIMQLTYNNQSLLGAGCYESTDAGISRFGKVVIEEMNRVGMVIDMSHSAEESTLQAIELSQRPIVISHANPTFFEPAKRNKSNKVLSALSESEGLLGFSMYPFHLKNGPKCTLDEFCTMVAQTVDLMGIDRVGMGSDLCLDQPIAVLEWMRNGRWTKQMDYGEGSASNAAWPDALSWFETSVDFPNIVVGLRDKGFNELEIEKIMGRNWLDFCAAGFGPK
jgi:membrane dipeptidase|tara:strand:- start:4719 stop:5702 length:984 start_codon:yes stop_codon:yes gene_type:complete